MLSYKGILSNKGFFTKILILIAAFCLGALIVIPVSSSLMLIQPSSERLMKVLQLVMSLGLFIFPPLLTAYLCSNQPVEFLQLNKKLNWKLLGYVVLLMIVVIPFINLLSDFNQHMSLPKAFEGIEKWMKTAEEQNDNLSQQWLNVNSVFDLALNIFVIALIPALGEELFFRGALLQIVRSWKGMIAAIWIIAFIFSAIHMQFYGFLPRMLMGAMFGYLLFWTENLWIPITAHFVNNLIAVIFYFLQNNNFKLPDIDKTGTGNTLWIGIVSGILTVTGLIIIKKIAKKGSAQNT